MEKQPLLSDQGEVPKYTFPGQQHHDAQNAGANAGPGQPEAVRPSAPPSATMDTVPGYEGIGAGGGDLPPPYPGDVPVQMPTPQPLEAPWQIPSISESVAQEAFIKYASSKCCYSTKPAKEMVFTDLQAHNTFRYRLETFTESRSTNWDSEPYNGQVADAYCGVAPKPWDIPVTAPALFKDNTKALKVPFTSSVKGCHTCLGLGLTACRHCVSSGWMQCSGCQGSGTRFSSDRCITCSGRGRVRCSYCSGMGSHQCKTCSGKEKLLCFIKLTVKWKNNVKEYAVDTRSGFPMDQIFSVSGEKVFSDTHPLVSPIRGFPADKINEASENSVREHFAQFSSSCRIMQQRQTIELVPITRVHYIWKENANFFFVYGNEHKVYTDDYPATCCCTLL